MWRECSRSIGWLLRNKNGDIYIMNNWTANCITLWPASPVQVQCQLQVNTCSAGPLPALARRRLKVNDRPAQRCLTLTALLPASLFLLPPLPCLSVSIFVHLLISFSLSNPISSLSLVLSPLSSTHTNDLFLRSLLHYCFSFSYCYSLTISPSSEKFLRLLCLRFQAKWAWFCFSN